MTQKETKVDKKHFKKTHRLKNLLKLFDVLLAALDNVYCSINFIKYVYVKFGNSDKGT
jgi:hypothetical protein